MAGGGQEYLLAKFAKVLNYSTFISDSIRCENVEIIRITRAKIEFGLQFKKTGWLRISLEKIYYYFHKMQPKTNQMSEKFLLLCLRKFLCLPRV